MSSSYACLEAANSRISAKKLTLQTSPCTRRVHSQLANNTRNTLNLKLFTGTHCLPTFIQAAAQLRGRRGFKADARLPGASGSKTSQNLPTTPPFLSQTAQQNLGATGLSEPNPQAYFRPGNRYTAD